MSSLRRSLGRVLTAPFLPLLVAIGISPNQLTVLGLAVASGAAALLSLDHLVAGGALVLVAALFDLLDGALARATQRATSFGALLDSVLDRLSEGAVLFGLLIHFVRRDATEEVLLVFAVAVASFVVSYIKARAEGLGLSCDVGLVGRAERVLLLALGLLIGQITILLYMVGALSLLTACHRFVYVWGVARRGGRP